MSALRVTVRMYDTRVGDCLLLSFRTGDETFHMLIDCGIHSQFKGGSEIIRAVAEDVKKATSEHLNLVVVTHEHGDHVSGFYLAEETFKSMQIDEAWLGWTEDPDNELAKRLDRARDEMLSGLRAAHQRLRASGSDLVEELDPVLGFFDVGETPEERRHLGFGARADDALALSSRAARNKAVELADSVRYLKPKTAPLELPGFDGVRVFVLGPPEDTRALMRARPSKRSGEVYEEQALVHALMAAGAATSGPGQADDYQPVAGNHRLPYDMVKANRTAVYRFFHDRYGFGKRHRNAWRRIDTDWLNATESLALKLDSATNNTSLVLAIELTESGRVLLFPGDAQVGNWHSWHDGGWSEQNGLKKGETISAENLLNRTVLYKVGHHGSHNATLRGKGLQMMTSPELCAMIPVNEDWAHKRRPHPWKMPFDPLYKDLLARTKGRILRSDTGLVTPKTDAVWDPFKADAVKQLYVELEIPDK